MSAAYLKNIAIVGAGGQMGRFITKALLATGKHRVTAISRASSDSKSPEGVHDTKKVDYDSRSDLAEALKGQDALIITVKAGSSPSAQTGLIDAAKDAGIEWIMPNEFGVDSGNNADIGRDTKTGPGHIAVREYIEKAGLSWIGLTCGFWYEYSLAGTEAKFGFNFHQKTVTFFDDGTVKIPTSTWTQAALAVARIFTWPLRSNGSGPSINNFRNQTVFVDSFFVSQRDMLASVLRVTGDKESDWTVTSEATRPRYERGVKKLSGGDYEGFAMLLYTRIFFPDGASDYTSQLHNKLLGLPEENIDDANKTAVVMAKVSNGHWSFHW